MYAVIRTGGKQYKVAVDDHLRVESLSGEKGDEVTIDDVILVSDEGSIKTGEAIANAQVKGTIVSQLRDKKVLIFKKNRRKNYRRTNGHRQSLTELKITAIQ
ncbi:MAG: 50S ribosomal protein L21 [Magnetococcales bacterium]|nr:50S ribosomal protein L21 [Magnetococcales bacterium]